MKYEVLFRMDTEADSPQEAAIRARQVIVNQGHAAEIYFFDVKALDDVREVRLDAQGRETERSEDK